jgi:hypothetical protein
MVLRGACYAHSEVTWRQTDQWRSEGFSRQSLLGGGVRQLAERVRASWNKHTLVVYSCLKLCSCSISISCGNTVIEIILWLLFVLHEKGCLFGGVRRSLWTAASGVPTVHPPDDTWVWRAMVDIILTGETEEVGERPVSATLSTTSPTQTWAQTRIQWWEDDD